MKFSLPVWTTFLAASLVSFTALADESRNEMSFVNQQNTLVLSVGRSTEQNGCDSPWLGAYSTMQGCSEKDTSYGISYEYHMTKTWGLELSYAQTGNATAKGIASFSNASAPWSMKARTIGYYGTGHLPLGNSFSVKGKIGVAHTNFSESIQTTLNGAPYVGVSLNGVNTINDSKIKPAFGIGMQYDFNQDAGILLQYDYFGSFDEYSLYKLGTPPQIRLSDISLGLALKW